MVRALTAALAVAACGGSSEAQPTFDASPADAPEMMGPDAASTDASPDASSPPDSALPDAPPPDAASPDAPPDAPAITGSALQLNDVSVLMPLPSTLAERDEGMLAATSAGPRGALFPATTLDAVKALSPSTGGLAFDKLRVVAMRIDPCFAVLAPTPDGVGCEAQIRLVLQPISQFLGEGGRHPAENFGTHAVHTFYRLTRAEVYALKDDLVSLRLASSSGEALGPLAPHPLIEQQGLTGEFSAGLRALILGAAGAENLTRVAVMNLVASQQWDFQIFDVIDPSQVSPRPIATLPPVTTKQSGSASNISAGDSTNGSGDSQFIPAPAGPDTFNELAATPLANQLSGEARRAQFDALMRTENPQRTTAETVACASCHFTMTVKRRVAWRFGLFDSVSADAFVANPAVVTPADLKPTFTTSEFSIHAFSYQSSIPMIVQRTVNESAAVLDYFASSPTP